MDKRRLPHIHLDGPTATQQFTTARKPIVINKLPERDRKKHGVFLEKRLEQAWQESQSEVVTAHTERHGVYLEFQSSPDFELKLQSLESMGVSEIRLCNVKKKQQDGGETTFATVFIPNEKRKHFLGKVEDYLNKETKSGKPKNTPLINGIDDIRKALLIDSFWQDDKKLIPDDNEAKWCEVWLRGDSDNILKDFELLLEKEKIGSKAGSLKFPERIVKLVHVTGSQLESITRNSDDIAEYRLAKSSADFWANLPPSEQAEWIDSLSDLLQIDNESLISVCILDTGVNNGHKLLTPLLDSVDCQSVEPDWGSHDHDGHGTNMAGLTAYGNLQQHLESSSPVEIRHKLESVKLLPPKGANPYELWGYLTKQAVSRAEIQAPLRKRTTCMAITSSDSRDRGRPSSWSGAIDQLTSGSEDETKRIMIISAGNVRNSSTWANYPSAQILDSIHDPAQSWNTLTVGAYTQLTDILNPDYKDRKPIAGLNQLSPFTTTSITWEERWPLKPEVVFEGGNAAVDSSGSADDYDELSLLTTHHRPHVRQFDAFSMTSAATALGARFAAQIHVEYPDYWPETIRALMIHSASWPKEMREQFVENERIKGNYRPLLRACGYGVPDLERALYCASNTLTLIAEAEIRPFKPFENRIVTNEMHLYELPWPVEVLQNLGETPVEMRVTLSYFIEPGPGEIGWKERYLYASHALRFNLNSPTESKEEFIRRINLAARDENNGKPDTKSPSDKWILGSDLRNKGSIHSDIWQGTAADLSESNLIAISPVTGWWKERKHLNRYNSKTRYSLIVSIFTPEQDIDIYTPVAQQIKPEITI